MKLSFSSSVLVAVGLAALTQAAPAPVQIIEVKGAGANAFSNFRLGHAAANHAGPQVAKLESIRVITFSSGHPNHDAMPHRPKKACGGMRMKAIQLSNWFREKTGYPLIETDVWSNDEPRFDFYPHPHPIPHPQLPPFPNPPPHRRPPPPPPPHHGFPYPPPPPPPPFPVPRPHVVPITIVHGGKAITPEGNYVPTSFMPIIPNREWYPSTFSGRLHKALITLGPWEGRAVAFVLGCGIGSLLRMFWVLVIVAFRSQRRRDQDIVEEVVIFEEIDDEMVAPPPPVYADEKVPVEEKPVVASA